MYNFKFEFTVEYCGAIIDDAIVDVSVFSYEKYYSEGITASSDYEAYGYEEIDYNINSVELVDLDGSSVTITDSENININMSLFEFILCGKVQEEIEQQNTDYLIDSRD